MSRPKRRAVVKPKTKVKLKSNSAASKRFSFTGTGEVKATQANKQHNMRKRSRRQIRNQQGTTILDKAPATIVKKYYNLHLCS